MNSGVNVEALNATEIQALTKHTWRNAYLTQFNILEQ